MRGYDLVARTVYIALTAANEFRHKTRRVHELWQSDFTYFKIIGRGCTIHDEYSRYFILGLIPLTEQIIKPEVYRECAH
ncbi:MAG: transposase family protein [Desulfarculaceae bacterium]|nr:transposase family protein [Desulfarculaceae bacterium]MCF8048440.1 transposase family protein [Desulfarculaceae bacterium]MCF8097720.1 transposase family protein [Desulfarculaceae bacterium]